MGLVNEAGRQIFIGPGIGTSILPVRFLTPPEVSVLRIYPAK
jgi:predicted MPP superfamily phosphohydrolase